MFPQTVDVMMTRASMADIKIVIGKIDDFPWNKAEEYCGMICQTPDNLGNIKDYSELFEKLRENGVRSILNADIMSMTICKSPGEQGADIAVGNGQRFGLPMGFGGPHPGYMACKDEFKRKMPGRIIGISKDADGEPALRMSM